MAAPILFRNPSSLLHDVGPHPERPDRIVAIESALDARNWLGFEVHLSPPATRGQLEAVHTSAHCDAIASLCEAGGGWIDGDTGVCADSQAAALDAAGGACALVDALLAGVAPSGASLHRPPGHHAESGRAMGFCLYNNIAIAARHALDQHGAGRVLIVDWDVHHGNGTQEIFWSSGDVLFASIHEWPLYPGSGAASERGTGAGAGLTLNLPVPAGSGDARFCSLVEHLIVPAAEAYAPELILISAGYDAHARDPLAGCRVTAEGFATMMRSLRALGDRIEAPVGLVLEGGYDLIALTEGLVATLAVLGAPEPVAVPDLMRDLGEHAPA